jgi:hypothetical protein
VSSRRSALEGRPDEQLPGSIGSAAAGGASALGIDRAERQN